MYSSDVYWPLQVSTPYFRGPPSSATARLRSPHSKAGTEPTPAHCQTTGHPDGFLRRRVLEVVNYVSWPGWHRRRLFLRAYRCRCVPRPTQMDRARHQTTHNRSDRNRLIIRAPALRITENIDQYRPLIYVHQVGRAYWYTLGIYRPMKYISPASPHISDKRRRTRPQRRPDRPATAHS